MLSIAAICLLLPLLSALLNISLISVCRRPEIDFRHRLATQQLGTTNDGPHGAWFPAGAPAARCCVLPSAAPRRINCYGRYGRGRSRSSGGAISVTRSRIRAFFGKGASAVTPSFSRTVAANSALPWVII